MKQRKHREEKDQQGTEIVPCPFMRFDKAIPLHVHEESKPVRQSV